MNTIKHILATVLLTGITASASAETVTDTWTFNKPATGILSNFTFETDESSPKYYGNFLPEGWVIPGTNRLGGWGYNLREGIDNMPCLVSPSGGTSKDVALVFYAHKGTLGFNMKGHTSYTVIRLFDATPDGDSYTIGDLAIMKEVEDLPAYYKVTDIEVPADGYYALTISGEQYINDISNTYEAAASTFSVGGTVTDETQTPLEGVTVKVGEAETSTDAEGKWSVPDLAAGLYTAEFSKTGYVSESAAFGIENDDITDLTVVMKQIETVLTGTVTAAEDAKPLEGVEITLAAKDDENLKYTATTDDAGLYAITLKGVLADAYELTAVLYGYITHKADVDALSYGEENTLSFAMKVDPAAGVEAIEDVRRPADIYTIDGKRIKPGAPLAPGLYIIAGRKVALP